MITCDNVMATDGARAFSRTHRIQCAGHCWCCCCCCCYCCYSPHLLSIDDAYTCNACSTQTRGAGGLHTLVMSALFNEMLNRTKSDIIRNENKPSTGKHTISSQYFVAYVTWFDLLCCVIFVSFTVLVVVLLIVAVVVVEMKNDAARAREHQTTTTTNSRNVSSTLKTNQSPTQNRNERNKILWLV